MSRIASHVWSSLLLGGVTLVALSIAPRPALAQQIVYDPSNHAENVLTAARALEQIRNQIAEIELQTRMLAKSPLQLSPELVAAIDEAKALLDAAEGIAFDVHRIGGDLATLYPETWETHDLEGVIGQSDRWLAQSRESLKLAMNAEARAARQLDASRGQIDRALGSSEGAEGQTAAVQAGNQILGVQAAQLGEIQALLIAQGRALETERMERIAREQRAAEILRRAFPTTAGPAPPPARTAF